MILVTLNIFILPDWGHENELKIQTLTQLKAAYQVHIAQASRQLRKRSLTEWVTLSPEKFILEVEEWAHKNNVHVEKIRCFSEKIPFEGDKPFQGVPCVLTMRGNSLDLIKWLDHLCLFPLAVIFSEFQLQAEKKERSALLETKVTLIS